MTHVTCRLTAKKRDQLQNPTLGNRVWATFTFPFFTWLITPVGYSTLISAYRYRWVVGLRFLKGRTFLITFCWSWTMIRTNWPAPFSTQQCKYLWFITCLIIRPMRVKVKFLFLKERPVIITLNNSIALSKPSTFGRRSIIRILWI